MELPAKRILPLLAALLGMLALAACRTSPPPRANLPITGPQQPITLNSTTSSETDFELHNAGDRALDWTITVEASPSNPAPGDWFVVEPRAGRLERGASARIGLTRKDGYPAGRYESTLHVEYEGGRTSFSVSGEIGRATEEAFGLFIEPDTLTVPAGGSASAKVTVVFKGDGVSSVSLEMADTPPGITATLGGSDEQVGTSLPLVVSVARDVPTGTYTLTAIGVGDGHEERATMALVVTGGGGGPGGSGAITGRLHTPNAAVPARPSASAAEPAFSPAALEERPEFVPGQLLVQFEPTFAASALGSEPEAQLRQAETVLTPLAASGVQLLEAGSERTPALLELPPGTDVRAAAAALEADPTVQFAEPNYLFYPLAVPNDPYVTDGWHLPVTGLPLAWEARSGSDVVVAVLDTGIDLDHEDLRGVFVSSGYDFCATSGCGARDPDPRPGAGDTHGTHVTGILAAVGGNSRGTAGVLQGRARVLPVKVFENGGATASALAAAVRWSAGESVSGTPRNSNPARIITMSLGAGTHSQTLRDAIRAATERGALVIAAAGNKGSEVVDYPARYPEVLAVGSVNSSLDRSCFSDYGAGLDLMAPGGDTNNPSYPLERCRAPRPEGIVSTTPGDTYGLQAGTSMAAPVVAGVAALVWSDLGSRATAEQVRARLLETAYFEPTYMTREEYGAGVVRADAALGFPGPGSEAAVTATGPTTQLATVTLDPYGSSTAYRLSGLTTGDYQLEASASGARRDLTGRTDARIGGGTVNADVQLTP